MPATLSRTVPTFSSDGRRLRGYSRETAKHFEGLSLAAVRRNRHGDIIACHLRDAHGGSPLRSIPMGQRYSFLEKVGDGRMWAFKKLQAA